MGALSQSEIVAFFADLHAKRQRAETENFCNFLDELFELRDLWDCTFFTSLATFCIVRYPAREWRGKPMLSLRIASSARLLIELRITTQTKPSLRATTESSSAPWNVAFDEFDRLYSRFMDAHDDLQ
ncbi:hypothetical protein MFFC18_13510 [Mariniblastus fucicola]|uniref:Uncharacterized protein n=1 Tax=Mariniblastus fucicola TaxID=980251 RepID=A0A5B9P8G3_9BACT|nr:hypothetical protein MFFC18_13510 [Mariniblastus fucicola]